MKCLICEQEIPYFDETNQQGPCGGHIRVVFGFGSQYDFVGLRKPKHHPTDPALKERPGYQTMEVGSKFLGKTLKQEIYIPGLNSEIETVPYENIPVDRKDLQIAASKNIKACICDSCFAKKIDLFSGTED